MLNPRAKFSSQGAAANTSHVTPTQPPHMICTGSPATEGHSLTVSQRAAAGPFNSTLSKTKPLLIDKSDDFCTRHSLPKICRIEEKEQSIKLCAICAQEYFSPSQRDEVYEVDGFEKIKREAEQAMEKVRNEAADFTLA